MIVDTNNLHLYVANELQLMIAQLPDESTTVNQLPARNASVSVFPNPADQSTLIRFSLPETRPLRMEIYNVSGVIVDVIPEMIYNPGIYSFRLNTASLPAGMYYLRLIGSNENKAQKFIVQH
jgi:hypothetical protein